MVNQQVASLVFVLLIVQVIKKFDLTDPEIIFRVRVLYAVSQSILFLCLYWCYTKIQSKNEKSLIKVTEQPKPFSTETPATFEQTIRDYDMSELKKLFQSSAISLALIGFLHYKFLYVQPLILQSILPLKNLFLNQIVKIHLRGKAPVGDLARPFKPEPSPFSMPTETEEPAPVADKKNE